MNRYFAPNRQKLFALEVAIELASDAPESDDSLLPEKASK